MEIEKLLNYNRSGLIPGPGEVEDKFIERADYCLNLKNTISTLLPEGRLSEALEKPILSEADEITNRLYGIDCNWVPLFFSNHKLSPWHGGCAWIFQETKESPKGAILQLRKQLAKSSTLFGYYKREELIAHELAHAGRMAYQEPVFEEVLAYRSSSSRFQRYFGPIVQSSLEAMLFLLIVFFILCLDLFLIFRSEFPLLMQVAWLKLIPLCVAGYSLVRLYRKHTAFAACLEKISQLTHFPDAVIYRLADKEIDIFANMDPSEILLFANRQTELRWLIIRKAYL